MNPHYEATVAWYENIAREGRENPSAHRRKICQNYLEHAALEYTDRWPEIFTPERTIEHPRYEVRWGTPETVVYDGEEAVKGFYTELKQSGGISNEKELLSVADWGFSSFLTINLHKTAEECFKEGLIPEVGDPEDCYVASTRCAMYWRYDSDARLEGEYVYEIEPGTLKQIPREHWLSVEELTEMVRPYLPHGREVGTSDAFQGAAA